MRKLILLALITTTFISCGKDSKKNHSGGVTYDTTTRYVSGIGYTCDRREIAVLSCVDTEMNRWCLSLPRSYSCNYMSTWQIDQQRLRARNYCNPFYPTTVCN